MTQQLARLSTNTALSTISEVVQSKSPIVAYVRKDEDLKKEFLKAVYMECLKFLMLMDCEDDKAKMLSEVFAMDVLEKRDTWKIEDVGMFFKHVRQNQDRPEYKIMGNKITILKLNEWAGIYEGDRSEALVEMHKQDAFKQIGQGVSGKAQEFAQSIVDRLESKLKPVDMSRAVEVKNWHEENVVKEKELRDQWKKGEITEEDYLIQYNQYLIR